MESHQALSPTSHILLGAQIVLGIWIMLIGYWNVRSAAVRARARLLYARSAYFPASVLCAVLGGGLAFLGVLALVL